MNLKKPTFFLLLLAFPLSNLFSYTVTSEKYSYFLLNAAGNLVHSNGRPIPADGIYAISVWINPKKTAIVVMDPWIDKPSDFLNAYDREITKNYLLPLVHQAHRKGHPIIILTNDPNKVNYNTQIDDELSAMVNDPHVYLLYHQNHNAKTFAKFLKKLKIDTLIYTGFASNMCVIGRPMGMIMMKYQGLRLFFVPEASAAIETVETWETGKIHEATTTIISQWIGNIIHWEDQMQSMRSL